MSQSFSTRFIAALTAREAEQHSNDTVTAINNATAQSVALDKVFAEPCFAEIGRTLIKRARIATPQQDKEQFIAVKVLVKIMQAVQALATGLPSALDPYTRTIGANLCKLNGVSNKSALVCLSKSVEYDALDQQQTLSKRYNCSPGTASTQSSSTRMMLKHMGICEVNKGKRGDVTTLLDNERARSFVKLYGEHTIAEEQQPAA